MKVLFVGLARTIWLFEFSLLNPTGMNLRVVLEEIGKRYQFAKIPKNELDVDEQRSLTFNGGTFVGVRGVAILVGLKIYNDGIVADTMSSTEDSSEFLDDLAKWLEEKYRLVVPKQRKINFLSQIDFESDVPLVNLNPRLGPFIKSIERRINSTIPLEVASIQFWTEEFGRPGVPAPIKIERKITAPFVRNHYFSQAPMSTKDHIGLLNDFEALLRER